MPNQKDVVETDMVMELELLASRRFEAGDSGRQQEHFEWALLLEKLFAENIRARAHRR
jgi:hypothetical protein